jgi:hypothetical protein
MVSALHNSEWNSFNIQYGQFLHAKVTYLIKTVQTKGEKYLYKSASCCVTKLVWLLCSIYATLKNVYPFNCLLIINTVLTIQLVIIRWHTTVTDLTDALPGSSSVNMVQHATIEEAMFSADPTKAPRDWLGSNHVICVTVGPCPFCNYKWRKLFRAVMSGSGRSTQTRGQQ